MSGRLTINLEALKQNYRTLDEQSDPSCETAAVVKANAYGLGIEECAPALYDAGARSFFVATIGEGTTLREILPYEDATIYILNGMDAGSTDKNFYTENRIIPVINSPDEMKQAQGLGRFPVGLHFDTSMNRLGLSAQEAQQLYAEPAILKDLDIRLIMSHFASSEEADNPENDDQINRFKEIMKGTKPHCPDARYALSNSGGVFLDGKAHFDLLRPGVALYGAHPSSSYDENPMHGCVNLDVPVLQIRAAKKGEGVGYNGTHKLEKDTDLVTLSIGYADGFIRSVSNKGSLYWKGYPLPIRGRVSMDSTICDLSAVPKSEYPKRGDMVEVIGKHQTIDDLAKDAGTIPYEVLTSLGHRYERVYKHEMTLEPTPKMNSNLDDFNLG